MCSIIGYSGNEIAAPIIVKGLKRMEYRGYDSVGVATESENQIKLKKGIGKVNEVNSKIQLEKKKRQNRYRPYKMGNSWRAFRNQRPPTSTLIRECFSGPQWNNRKF